MELTTDPVIIRPHELRERQVDRALSGGQVGEAGPSRIELDAEPEKLKLSFFVRYAVARPLMTGWAHSARLRVAFGSGAARPGRNLAPQAARLIEPGSVRVLSTIGDERSALITVTFRIGLGPGGTMLTMARSCLYWIDEDKKIKEERDAFFMLSQ